MFTCDIAIASIVNSIAAFCQFFSTINIIQEYIVYGWLKMCTTCLFIEFPHFKLCLLFCLPLSVLCLVANNNAVLPSSSTTTPSPPIIVVNDTDEVKGPVYESALFAAVNCPTATKYGSGPPASCSTPSDPNNRPKSGMEQWFTKQMFLDLFPYANIGWGPNSCYPYSYESFVIAARYFPGFGTTSPQNGLSNTENTRRDVSAFFAHAIQETGMNDISLYSSGKSETDADSCFYRGGLFNWFEGGPVSAFLNPSSPGYQPKDGNECSSGGRYCSPSEFYPCGNGTSGNNFKSCYFGRGAIQISYNYNYGQFQDWLATQNASFFSLKINVDLLTTPNLIMTKSDPPLALLASLWFYMTPQPPKPAMHDIILGMFKVFTGKKYIFYAGRWEAGSVNKAAGYSGPILGPTSLVINNECNGEDATAPGGGGENRRIRAFKWFTKYYGVATGNESLLSCKDMPQRLDQIPQNVSYQPDWSSTWKEETCKCAPVSYGGNIPYFQPNYYPQEFVALNAGNEQKCVKMLYANPAAFNMDSSTSACLNYPPKQAD
uniref:Glycoside hydrolase family 19 catalytic domain-containing protein n=1 Tax=Ditylenchus dipsaci TaxID=166011 RepID=A0A915DUI7_9BILA